MATPQGPTNPTVSALVDGQSADASDVLTPINELATAVDEARGTALVSENDTTKKYLEAAIVGGDGISVATQDAGANETLQITCTIVASPVGTMMPFLGGVAPSGWLLCDGSLISLTEYSDLVTVLNQGVVATGGSMLTRYGAETGNAVTADAATDKLLATGHGLSVGDVIFFNTTDTLPAPLTSQTVLYYVVEVNANDFKISDTPGGTAIDLTDAGTGTHYYFTRVKLPDLRGRAIAGLDNMGGSSANRVTDTAGDSTGGTMGAETHTLTVAELPSHAHDLTVYQQGSGSATDRPQAHYRQPALASGTNTTTSEGSDSAHNNMQPTFFTAWIVKS